MRVIIYSIIFLILAGCGFKIVNQSENQRYKINEIEFKGENRVNYFIKNKLLKKSNNESLNNEITLLVTTKKSKIIKEKNIKNEITKYQIDIIIKVEFEEVGKSETYQLDLSKSGDFDVSNRYSQTLENEKKLTKLLTNDITDDLLNLLINKLNEL